MVEISHAEYIRGLENDKMSFNYILELQNANHALALRVQELEALLDKEVD